MSDILDDVSGDQFTEQLGRVAVGGYDDAQDVRKAMMNRIRDLVRKKREGIPFDQIEEEKENESYSSEYDDENLEDLVDEMRDSDTLSVEETKYLRQMLDAAEKMIDIEEQFEESLKVVKSEPIYEAYLDDVYGVSHTLTARLIFQFGYCESFSRVSQLWSYSGFAPGQTRNRGEQLGFNPDAKTLGWMISDTMIKMGSRSLYRANFYDPYKEKQLTRLERNEDGACIKCGERDQMASEFSVMPWECKECGQEGFGEASASRHMDAMEQKNEPHSVMFHDRSEQIHTDLCGECAQRLMSQGESFPTAPNSRGHADNRARRYLSKKFLKHYWAIARSIKGYDTPDEWIITHGGHDKETETFENPFYALEEVKKPR